MHPLRLPELRMLIGQYLPQRDLLACILVCKAWHADFQSLLFRSITLDDATLRVISREALYQHAHLIRHLVLTEPMRLTISSFNPDFNCCAYSQTHPHPPLTDPPPCSGAATTTTNTTDTTTTTTGRRPLQVPFSQINSCTNLISLDINPSMLFRRRIHEQIPKYKIHLVGTDQYNDLYDDFWSLQSTSAIIRLIQQNSNLQALAESWDEMSPFHRIRFTKQLCQLQHNRLRILHLCKWEVSLTDINRMIGNLPSLFLLRFSKLTLMNSTGVAVGLHSSSPSPTGTALQQLQQQQQHRHSFPPFTPLLDLQHLRVLIMTHATFQMNDLRIEGPHLAVLNVSFSQVQSKNVWSTSPNIVWNTPALQQLIHNRTDRSIGTASLFSSPLSLRAVSFADYELPPQLTTEIVRAQGQHLQSLRLACFTGVTPADLRLILTSCPNLVNFCAPEIRIWAGDLVPVVALGGLGPSSVTQGAGTGAGAGAGAGATGLRGGDGAFSTRGRGVKGSQQYKADQEMAWRYNILNSQHGTHSIQSQPIQPHDSGDRKEWVCHKLERLSIYVSLEPAQEDDEMLCYPFNVQEHGYGNEQGQGLGQHSPSSPSSQSSPSSPPSLDKEAQFRHFKQQQHLQQEQFQKQSWHQYHRRFHYQLHHHRQHQEAIMDRARVAFLDQLSKLTRLKHLDLSGEHMEKASLVQIGLPWTLAGGLEQLATLRELEHIAVTGWIDQMGPEEIGWMKRSWPKLTHVSLLKTETAGMARFQGLLAEMWPELIVKDKARNKGFCPPLYLR